MRRIERSFPTCLVVVVALLCSWLTAPTAEARGATLPAAVHTFSASDTGSAIVNAARSQIGYKADPYGTNCNKFSAHWGSGAANCGNGNRNEAWCADFAAWAWEQAGITGLYGHGITGWAGSFRTWGQANGRWHPIGDGYSPQPGDAVEYADAHVGIYSGGPANSPTVINGNWWYPDRGTGQVYESHNETSNGGGAGLTGYISAPQGGSSASAGYEEAFQANTHSLWTTGDQGTPSWNLGMAAGTSPSIAVLPGGGYVTAFQANTGNLWIVGPGAPGDTGQGMMAGTSPSIAASPNGGWRAAFQANTGNLYQFDSSSGAANLQQGMARPTSPGIAALSNGGYEMTFQANTGYLYVFGDAQSANTQQGMMAGTSPSIAASRSGGFKVAFQANTGNLYTFVPGQAANLQQGMASTTSPAISALSGSGYEIAFQANTGNLYVFGDGGSGNTQQGMMAGSSPGIAASPGGGFRAVFQANTGNMYLYDSSGGASNAQLGMDSNTSPCISSTLGGGCAPGSPLLQAQSTPLITGRASVGSKLTATTGAWAPAPDQTTFQWNRSGSPIAGATSNSYTVSSGDVGRVLSVTVTASGRGFRSGVASSAAVTVAAGTLTAPVPTVTGTAKVGQTVTAKPGTWGPAPVALSYQWLRDGTAISKATGSSYVLIAADLGHKISVKVTGSKSGYTTTAKTSAAVAVAAGVLTAPTPTISGTVKVGQTLTGRPGTWGPAPVALTYQWLRDGKGISKATAVTYKLTTADKGHKVSIRVTGTKTAYTTVAKTSAAVTPTS